MTWLFLGRPGSLTDVEAMLEDEYGLRVERSRPVAERENALRDVVRAARDSTREVALAAAENALRYLEDEQLLFVDRFARAFEITDDVGLAMLVVVRAVRFGTDEELRTAVEQADAVIELPWHPAVTMAPWLRQGVV